MVLKYRFLAILIIFSILLLTCKDTNTKDNSFVCSDKKATKETKTLFKNFKKLSSTGFLFGHHDTECYGVKWKYDNSKKQSDVNNVCGDFPSLYGGDLGHIELDSKYNLDSVEFDVYRKIFINAFSQGKVITVSWHLNNPVNNKSSWDQTTTVKYLLPGQDYYEKFDAWVGKVAVFFNSLKDSSGTPVPVVFRPFHEMNGNWFWWGKNYCSKDEYIQLWRTTVNLLRNKYKVHNILYAYSPNLASSKKEYLERYPGDGYVDILGIDFYDSNGQFDEYMLALQKNIALIREIASDKNKIFVLSETGRNKIPENNWWMRRLYPGIKNSGISWILVWRNADTNQYFVPYKELSNAKDFVQFYNLPETIFENDLPEMYK